MLHVFRDLVDDIVHCVVNLICVMYCVLNTELLAHLAIGIVLYLDYLIYAKSCAFNIMIVSLCCVQFRALRDLRH